MKKIITVRKRWCLFGSLRRLAVIRVFYVHSIDTHKYMPDVMPHSTIILVLFISKSCKLQIVDETIPYTCTPSRIEISAGIISPIYFFFFFFFFPFFPPFLPFPFLPFFPFLPLSPLPSPFPSSSLFSASLARFLPIGVLAYQA